MTEPRITPLDSPFPDDVAPYLARMTPGGQQPLALFRTLAKNPVLFQRMMATGGHFLGKDSTLTLRDREIVIDRTCARCHCEYEWGVHVAAFAKAANLTDAEVRHTVSNPPDPDAWAPHEAALLALVDALHETSTVDDDTWATLASHYDDAQCIELVVLVGWYHAIAFACNALRVPLESWQARLPRAL